MSTKILIVEDDKNINMMAQIILKNKKLDWELRGARDGVEALEILKTYKADLALVDLGLPKMDGAELVMNIRKDKELANCRVAVLTATKDESLKERVRAAGVREVWLKPIQADVLFSNIQAMLR
jgi:DNA-binding response OmpR family regulator